MDEHNDSGVCSGDEIDDNDDDYVGYDRPGEFDEEAEEERRMERWREEMNAFIDCLFDQELDITEHLNPGYCLDDNDALRIGGILKWATSLKKLEFIFQSTITEKGIQALINGLQQCQVTHLVFDVSDDEVHPSVDVLRVMFEAVIPTMQDLRVDFAITEDEANCIGSLLLRFSDQRNTQLKNLTLTIGSTVTTLGARQLAAGFCGWKLERLELRTPMTFNTTLDESHHAALQVLMAQAVNSSAQELVLFPDPPLNDEDVMAVGAALVGNSSLQSLSIRFALSARGAAVLADGIRHSQIVCLHLKNALLRPRHDRAPDTVTQVLLNEGARHAPALRHLWTSQMNDAAALASCVPQLHSFSVNANRMHVPTFVQGMMAGTSQLSILKLSSMHLTARDMMSLCSALPNLLYLTSLTLHGNMTCERGDALFREQGLDCFMYRRSEFDATLVKGFAAEQLMLAVANLPSFRRLDLSNSHDIHLKSLEMLGLQLPHVRFKELIINGIKNSRPSDEIWQERDGSYKRAGLAFVAGMRDNVYLQLIECNQYLFPPHTESLKFYVELNKHGRYLLQLEDGLPPGVWCHVLGKCRKIFDWSKKVGVMYYLLREQPQLLLSVATIRRSTQVKRTGQGNSVDPPKRRRG